MKEKKTLQISVVEFAQLLWSCTLFTQKFRESNVLLNKLVQIWFDEIFVKKVLICIWVKLRPNKIFRQIELQ